MGDCRKDANLQSDSSVNSTVPRAVHAVINDSASASCPNASSAFVLI